MKVKDMEISKLKPYANNPRKNEAAIVPVAESIKAFGFKVPIVIDKAGVIVAGHTRLEAAKRLGLDKVPCVVADDLTPEQVKAFRLADNKVSEFAVWDAEKLAEELADISTFDMKEFGFNAGGKEFFERKNKDGDTRQEGNEHKPAFKMHRRCTITRLLRGPVHCIKIAVFFHHGGLAELHYINVS